MELLGNYLLISIIAFIAGYYTRSKTQTLLITDTINNATDTLQTATDTLKNYKSTNENIEDKTIKTREQPKGNTEELEALDKQITKKKAELKEWESKTETAKHIKWKEEREEKIVITKVIKDDKNANLIKQRAV